MSFEQFGLHPLILNALESCGYTIPTPVQAATIPSILEGKDVVACAQTGTGKTAAFVLPSLHLLAERKGERKARVLILTPTRELADQIKAAADKYGKFLKHVRIISLVGGMPYGKQLRELPGANIIIATPGRLLDHMERGRVDLSGIEMLVLDEADRMTDMGFSDDMKLVAKQTPSARQTLLLSATMDSRLAKDVEYLLKKPVIVDLSTQTITPKNIEQHFYLADNADHKMQLFDALLQSNNIFKAIIFCATKSGAADLADILCEAGYQADAIHGDLKQNVRNRVMERFRGRGQFLVATDVAARGINVSSITHVFNYDVPRSPEDYVHRIGRTGRGENSGIAISFLLANQGREIRLIEKYVGKQLSLSTIAGLEPTKRLNEGGAKGKPRQGQGKRRFAGGGGRSAGGNNGRREGGQSHSPQGKPAWRGGRDRKFQGGGARKPAEKNQWREV